MMKVLVISDSHGNLDNVEKIMNRHKKFDLVIHLGDIIGQDETLKSICGCPVKVVKGNCDYYTENKITEVFELEHNTIMATHGHHYSVDWGIDGLYYAAQENKCNIAMYGHTHIPEIFEQGDVTIINPGSVSRPRQLNRKPSYIIMDIDKNGKAGFAINYMD